MKVTSCSLVSSRAVGIMYFLLVACVVMARGAHPASMSGTAPFSRGWLSTPFKAVDRASALSTEGKTPFQRALVQRSAMEDASSYDTCETAKLIQPAGPGSTVELLDETLPRTSKSRRVLCGTYHSDRSSSLYYKLIGTGNPFYITTCNYPNLPENDTETVAANLDLVGNLKCSSPADDDIPEPDCIAQQYGSSYNCPKDTEGFVRAFVSENGTEYTFSVSDWLEDGDPNRFNLRVGELYHSEDLGNSCEMPHVIDVPMIGGSPISILQDNVNIYNTQYESLCGDRQYPDERTSSGRWFAMDSPGLAKVSISTCSNVTTLLSTMIGITVERSDEIISPSTTPCSRDSLLCLKERTSDYSCDRNSELAAIDFVSRPGERYLLYVSSENAIDFGSLELTIAADEINVAYQIESDERLRREKARVGVACGWPGVSCRDGCLYCGEGDHCFNRTDKVEFDNIEYSASLTSFAVDVDYFQGRNESFLYELVQDTNECKASLGGMECASCVDQACGAPLVNCSNVEGASEFWNEEELDLCQLGSYFSTAPTDHNQKRSCSRFLSEEACDQVADEIEVMDSLACRCELDPDDASSNLLCSTECGLFCNPDQTLCGLRSVDNLFDAQGELDRLRRDFRSIPSTAYTIASLSSYNPYDGSSCSFSRSYESCDTCQLKTCSGDDNRLSFQANCSNLQDGAFFDACDPSSLVSENSTFGFFSATECYDDIIPTNSRCTDPIPVSVNSTVLGSNLRVPSGYSEVCGSYSRSLFYSVVGTGQWMVAYACPEDGTDASMLAEIVHGPCDNATCLTEDPYPYDNSNAFCGTENGATLEWESELGKEYLMHVSSTPATSFSLTVEALNWTDSMLHCEAEAAMYNTSEFDCRCEEVDDLAVSVLYCNSTCTRCEPSEDNIFCGDIEDAAIFDYFPGPYRERRIVHYASGFEGFAAVDMFLREDFCRAAVGDNFTESGVATDCECEVVMCDNGRTSAILNCTEYQEGLVLDLCSGSGSLAILGDRSYGECSEDITESSSCFTSTNWMLVLLTLFRFAVVTA